MKLDVYSFTGPVTLAIFLVTGALNAQNPFPAPIVDPDPGNEKLIAIEFPTIPAPLGTTPTDSDWLAVVDSEDANDVLGVSQVIASNGSNVTQVNNVEPPTGSDNRFHFIYFDQSEDLFFIVEDSNGDIITDEFLDLSPEDNYIDGYLADVNGFASMTFPGMSSFMDLASVIDILPVELTTFTGQYDGKFVDLTWSTASETNNDYFSVERSTDAGTNFVAIGQVRGAGNSQLEQQYNFPDGSPGNGLNHYRLRQVDFDGTSHYSDVISVDVSGRAPAIRLTPNPAVNVANVAIPADATDASVSVQLIDGSGRVVTRWQQLTGTSTPIDLTDLAAGIYQVRAILATDQVSVQRLIVR